MTYVNIHIILQYNLLKLLRKGYDEVLCKGQQVILFYFIQETSTSVLAVGNT